jgi:protein-arginine kinase activator protein McsA
MIEQGKMCQCCQEQPATCWSAVDFRSDTDIPVCSECADLLADGMRYQYYHNAPRGWQKRNQRKLDNAWNALQQEYQREAAAREAGAKAYRKAYNKAYRGE